MGAATIGFSIRATTIANLPNLIIGDMTTDGNHATDHVVLRFTLRFCILQSCKCANTGGVHVEDLGRRLATLFSEPIILGPARASPTSACNIIYVRIACLLAAFHSLCKRRKGESSHIDINLKEVYYISSVHDQHLSRQASQCL